MKPDRRYSHCKRNSSTYPRWRVSNWGNSSSAIFRAEKTPSLVSDGWIRSSWSLFRDTVVQAKVKLKLTETEEETKDRAAQQSQTLRFFLSEGHDHQNNNLLSTIGCYLVQLRYLNTGPLPLLCRLYPLTSSYYCNFVRSWSTVKLSGRWY